MGQVLTLVNGACEVQQKLLGRVLGGNNSLKEGTADAVGVPCLPLRAYFSSCPYLQLWVEGFIPDSQNTLCLLAQQTGSAPG